MRNLILAFAILLSPAIASAQWGGGGDNGFIELTCPGCLSLGGGTLTGPVLFTDGTATAPSVAIGDTDTGFYGPTTTSPTQFTYDGVRRWLWQGDAFYSHNSSGPSVNNSAATSTNPTFRPNVSDPGTGLTSCATGSVGLVSNSVNVLCAPETAGGLIVDLNGAIVLDMETSTGTDTASDYVRVHVCNSGGAYVLTLPTHNAGQQLRVINKGAGTVTLTPTSGNIKGAATLDLLQWEDVTIISDGTDWL